MEDNKQIKISENPSQQWHLIIVLILLVLSIIAAPLILIWGVKSGLSYFASSLKETGTAIEQKITTYYEMEKKARDAQLEYIKSIASFSRNLPESKGEIFVVMEMQDGTKSVVKNVKIIGGDLTTASSARNIGGDLAPIKKSEINGSEIDVTVE